MSNLNTAQVIQDLTEQLPLPPQASENIAEPNTKIHTDGEPSELIRTGKDAVLLVSQAIRKGVELAATSIRRAFSQGNN